MPRTNKIARRVTYILQAFLVGGQKNSGHEHIGATLAASAVEPNTFIVKAHAEYLAEPPTDPYRCDLHVAAVDQTVGEIDIRPTGAQLNRTVTALMDVLRDW